MEMEHRVRILAKRLRYGIEVLRALLPKQHTQEWYDSALGLQTTLGLARDRSQAVKVAAIVEAEPEIVAFLRGVAAGGGAKK